MDGDHGISDQNYLVWNQGKNPLVNFNFMLRVEMVFDLPCKSVRAFSRELEYDFIQEGGLNDYVHMRRKPITRPFTLEVERYVGVDYVDPMPLGAELALPVLLFVSRSHDQFIPFLVARTYTFTGCTVIKKTYGDLVADQSGLLVETTTLAYREMMCVDIPWSEVADGLVSPPPGKSSQAATADPKPSMLKKMGNDLLAQAQAFNTKAQDGFKAETVDELIQQLEDTGKELDKALGEGGTLQQAVADAESGLKNEEGKSLDSVAKELQDGLLDLQKNVDEKKKLMDEAYDPVRQKEAAYYSAQYSFAKAEDDLEEAERQLIFKKKDKTSAEARKVAAQKILDGGDQSLKTAQRKVTDAENAKSLADAEYETALANKDILTEEDLADAERKQKQAEYSLKEASDELSDIQIDIDEAPGKIKDAEEDIAEANAAISEAEKIVEAKTNDRNAAEEPYNEAKKAYDAAKEPYDAAQKEYFKAQKEQNDAEEKSLKALNAASEARHLVAKAESNLNKCKKRKTELQNTITNLKSRKKISEDAQKACATALGECEKANTKLQGIDDANTSDQNTAFKEVKKAYKETDVQKRKTLEIKNYLNIAQKILDDTKEIL